jgi:hypothetical protein
MRCSRWNVLTLLAVLVLLPGCATRALLKLGTAGDPPDHYDRAHRTGDRLTVEYDYENQGGKPSKRFFAGKAELEISKLSWQAMSAGDPEPACLPRAWAALGSSGPEVAVPFISDRPARVREVVDLHAKSAAGTPLLSIQSQGLGFWLLCGTREHLARAEVYPASAPEGGRSAGAITAIVLLFPFALVVDICGGFIYALAHTH